MPEIIGAMKDEDILMLCADHGNDPIHSGWDHTREYVLIMIFAKALRPELIWVLETALRISARPLRNTWGYQKPKPQKAFIN